ncbi:MAG: hypothetical protein HY289_09710 [Planctomycetes bacterium]|nr:hypothetical protein [Planctomycetota bacterium]
MQVRISFAVLVALLALLTFSADAQQGEQTKTSPHAAAIQLVLKTQQARIREIDRENWDHDVKERTWSVRRPFHPGIIDSTRMFNVCYRIDGKEVAAWTVDTAAGTVQAVDAKKK